MAAELKGQYCRTWKAVEEAMTEARPGETICNNAVSNSHQDKAEARITYQLEGIQNELWRPQGYKATCVKLFR